MPDSSELVVLSLLAEGPRYGYAISKHVATKSEQQLRLTPGVLYPLLKSLESRGFIVSSWEEVKSERASQEEEGRKRKWYRLSAKGRRYLEQKIAAHRAYHALIDLFIGTNPGRSSGSSHARTAVNGAGES